MAARIVTVVWGVGGIAAVLAYAIVKLSLQVGTALATPISGFHWLLFALSIGFMAWAEGYRGFQQRFSPRVAARALHLATDPAPLRLALAPLFCAGFFAATSRVLRLTWIGTALIVLAVLLVQQLAQPWRGILDSGVVVGLLWGLVSLLAATAAAFRSGTAGTAAEVTPAPSANRSL